MIKIAGVIGFVVMITSCDIINPDEKIPSYIYVPAAKLTTNKNEEGASTHAVTDVWAYNDGKYLGTYSLPATIPVLKEGQQNIELVAGIQVNGISTTRAQYPFFSQVQKELTLTPKTFDTIRPVFQYNQTTQFPYIEDFEEGNGFFNFNRITAANDSNVAFGDGAGYLAIPASSDTTYYFESKDPYSVPGEGAPVFLEMDYKTDVDITAGLRLMKGSESSDKYKLNIRKQENWSKIYINYTPEVTKSKAAQVKILFKVTINQINEDAKVYLDNIKLVH